MVCKPQIFGREFEREFYGLSAAGGSFFGGVLTVGVDKVFNIFSAVGSDLF
jgi:hypothetical protein